MATPPLTAELEIGLHRLDASRHSVELRTRPPDSDADMAPVRGVADFDLESILAAEWDGPEAAGQALTKQLFADPDILAHYRQASTAAEAVNAVLRIRLFIGPTAPELHALKWELLQDPDTGQPLATRDRVLFSRFLSGADWRPVRLRPQEEIRALVVIANPSDLATFKMAPLDVAGELRRAREALGEVPGVEVTGKDTFARMVEQLRDEFDILYLVCHGVLDGASGEPYVWLESAEGTSDRRPGRELVDRLGELSRPPRLVVLASCQSGGDAGEGEAGEGGVLAALGPRLAEAGIPAVVAMQGNVKMATLARFMPVFFKELLQRGGQIDRAMAAARAEVHDCPDAWVPALYLRLNSGRIWYAPGFARTPGDDFDLWPGLLTYLRPQRPKGTPILGSGLLEPYLGPTRDFARRWAERNHFPLASHAREDLPQVAQYLSVNFRASALRDMFDQELGEVLGRHAGAFGVPLPDTMTVAERLSAAAAGRRQKRPNDPHRVLATLPFPIYLTTNPDNLLVDALREVGKNPEVGLCPWSEKVDWSDSVFARDPDFRPTVDRPLVYYLFGKFDDPSSLVLTEDDYFDYLIGLTRNNELIPGVVRRALVDSALLFLGFRLDDWDFRVLFRSLMAQGGRRRSDDYAHVAVQIDPEDGRNLDPEGARRYLQRYFQDADIRIYWGQVDDFGRQLNDRWTRAQASAAKGRP